MIVCKVARGFTLLSEPTGAPVARFRPTGDGDTVQVLWWNGERAGRYRSALTADEVEALVAFLNVAHHGRLP